MSVTSATAPMQGTSCSQTFASGGKTGCSHAGSYSFEGVFSKGLMQVYRVGLSCGLGYNVNVYDNKSNSLLGSDGVILRSTQLERLCSPDCGLSCLRIVHGFFSLLGRSLAAQNHQIQIWCRNPELGRRRQSSRRSTVFRRITRTHIRSVSN